MFTKPHLEKELKNLSIRELSTRGYLYRYKKIAFNGLGTPHTPQRKEDKADEFDFLFKNKEDFDTWHKQLTVGLAELDESMNFCKYFVREKGNNGHYVREGKSYPVNGSWVGIQDFDDTAKDFAQWLKENGWRNNWFELMDRYKQYV